MRPVWLSYNGWSSSLACRKTAIANYLTRRSYATQVKRHPGLYAGTEQGVDAFQALGVKPAIVASLRDTFPHIHQPTVMQKRLIRAVVDKKDLILQDETGTGKSFAILLALLSKPRVVTYDPDQKDKVTMKEAITTLLLVPHRDLAYQYLHWIYHLMKIEGNAQPCALSSTVQVLVRHSGSKDREPMVPHILEAMVDPRGDLSVLRNHSPHILIATPNAALDVIHKEPEILQLSTLSTVVIDEADALVDWDSPYDKKKTRKKSGGKLHQHQQVLPQVLDLLYDVEQGRNIARPIKFRKSLLQKGFLPLHRPQLIMLSATMRNRLRTALFGAYGWYQRGKTLKLIKNGSSSRPTDIQNQSATHHVLVVSDNGDIKNASYACVSKFGESGMSIQAQNLSNPAGESEDDEHLFDDYDDALLEDDIDTELLRSPLGFNPTALEAIATTFALEVPYAALLVLPATAPVHKVVFELRQLGVDAHALDLVTNHTCRTQLLSRGAGVVAESPILLVSTLATTRGIDFPELSHVFLLGLPQGREGDSYLHTAGRVGRFGRHGKVITVLEERREQEVKKGKVAVIDEPKKMSIILSRIGVAPTKLAHFD